MLEVCFSNSLRGSLMCAKEKRGGRVIVASVFGWDENGHPPTEEEIEAHKRRVQEEHEKVQKEMIPLGGQSWQVFAFPFGLSQGDISSEIPLEEIRKSHYGQKPHPFKEGLSHCDFFVDELARMLTIVQNGEELRIWYDPRNPDDVCGLYWFLWMLKKKEIAPEMWLMPLPDYFRKEDGSIHVCRGWGEIEPEKLGHHLHLQREVSIGFVTMACTEWEKLRKENAPLRAVVNGKISSVAEEFYDGIIRMELDKQPMELKESNLIGHLLVNTCLSVMGDEFIHRRLLNMVKKGELQIIVPGENGSYRGQILKKIQH